MKTSMQSSFAFLAAVVVHLSLPGLSLSPHKESGRERTIDEIRTEAIHRAEVGQYPLIGLDPGDVKEAFESIHTTDKDEWAAGFHARRRSLLQRGEGAGEDRSHTRPMPTTSAHGGFIPSGAGRFRRLRASSARMKRRSKHFWRMRKFFDPPLEVVRIPFEGKEIIGYLRLPKNAKGPVPLVIAVNGLDSRKEDLDGKLRRNSSLRNRLSRRRWPRHGTGSDQSERDCGAHAVARN